MPEGGMYDNIFEQDIRKIDFLMLCSVDSVSKIESLKKKMFKILFSAIMGPFCLFWVIVCERFRFNWPDIDANSSTLMRDVHCMSLYTLDLPETAENSWKWADFT